MWAAELSEPETPGARSAPAWLSESPMSLTEWWQYDGHTRAQCQLAPAPLWPLGNDSAEGRRAAPGEARVGELVSAQDTAEHETQTETAQQRFAANDAARSEQHNAGAGSTDPADLMGSGAAQTSGTGACRGERGDAASASGRQAAPGEARFGEPASAQDTAEHETETETETETAQLRVAANDAARSEQHSAGAGSTDPADLVGSGAAQTSDTGACRGERGDAASASGRQAAPGEARFGEPVPARSTAEHEAETEHETQRLAARDAARSEEHSAAAGGTEHTGLVSSGAVHTSGSGECRGEPGDAASASDRPAVPGEARLGEPVSAQHAVAHGPANKGPQTVAEDAARSNEHSAATSINDAYHRWRERETARIEAEREVILQSMRAGVQARGDSFAPMQRRRRRKRG